MQECIKTLSNIGKFKRISGTLYLNLTEIPVLNDHYQKDQKLVFKTNYRLMQVKSIAECSKRSILQYF